MADRPSLGDQGSGSGTKRARLSGNDATSSGKRVRGSLFSHLPGDFDEGAANTLNESQSSQTTLGNETYTGTRGLPGSRDRGSVLQHGPAFQRGSDLRRGPYDPTRRTSLRGPGMRNAPGLREGLSSQRSAIGTALSREIDRPQLPSTNFSDELDPDDVAVAESLAAMRRSTAQFGGRAGTALGTMKRGGAQDTGNKGSLLNVNKKSVAPGWNRATHIGETRNEQRSYAPRPPGPPRTETKVEQLWREHLNDLRHNKQEPLDAAATKRLWAWYDEIKKIGPAHDEKILPLVKPDIKRERPTWEDGAIWSPYAGRAPSMPSTTGEQAPFSAIAGSYVPEPKVSIDTPEGPVDMPNGSHIHDALVRLGIIVDENRVPGDDLVNEGAGPVHIPISTLKPNQKYMDKRYLGIMEGRRREAPGPFLFSHNRRKNPFIDGTFRFVPHPVGGPQVYKGTRTKDKRTRTKDKGTRTKAKGKSQRRGYGSGRQGE